MKARADLDHVEGIGQVDGAGIGAEEIKQRVLDHDRKSERDQKKVAVLAMRRRPDDKALQRIAGREKQRRQQKHRQIGIKPKQRIGEERGEHRRGQAARRGRN